ncbi:MAG TPA: response regulator transcription factor [Polyangiaceae bacterium]|nr:response regulator transcription factor [Polyangiaceae bacterium]
MRILLVDDDAELCDLLREYFAGHAVELDAVGDGATGLERLNAEAYDALLLDVMLPGADGFEICRRVRATSDVPIIMLTARGDDDARIDGLDLGADDYVPKPFNPRELLARLRAVMRRSKPSPALTAMDSRFVIGDLVIDVPGQKAQLGEGELALTSFEFRLLVELARRAGRIVRRKELATALDFGEYDPSVDRSLDVHISHLRSKLQDDARDPKRIRTVRGVGYVLVRPA